MHSLIYCCDVSDRFHKPQVYRYVYLLMKKRFNVTNKCYCAVMRCTSIGSLSRVVIISIFVFHRCTLSPMDKHTL